MIDQKSDNASVDEEIITHNYYCTLWVSLDKAMSTAYLAQSEALPLRQGHTSLI